MKKRENDFVLGWRKVEEANEILKKENHHHPEVMELLDDGLDRLLNYFGAEDFFDIEEEMILNGEID